MERHLGTQLADLHRTQMGGRPPHLHAGPRIQEPDQQLAHPTGLQHLQPTGLPRHHPKEKAARSNRTSPPTPTGIQKSRSHHPRSSYAKAHRTRARSTSGSSTSTRSPTRDGSHHRHRRRSRRGRRRTGLHPLGRREEQDGSLPARAEDAGRQPTPLAMEPATHRPHLQARPPPPPEPPEDLFD